MLLARAFDTKISSLYKAGKITGGVYLGRGHEAIAACGGVFLTAGYDVIAPFIREQAARVTWGEPIIEAARAYLGSALGYMKGRDGNVHRGLPAEGYMAPISHLGFRHRLPFRQAPGRQTARPRGSSFLRRRHHVHGSFSRSRQYGERGAAASGARGNQ